MIIQIGNHKLSSIEEITIHIYHDKSEIESMLSPFFIQSLDPQTTKAVTISMGDPPLDPSTPNGETNGNHNTIYTYTTSTTDTTPDDELYYFLNRGKKPERSVLRGASRG